jgi:hypothetical protein
MYGLLYPAVLGTVLINLFIPLSRFVQGRAIGGPEFGVAKLVLTLGVVFHFIVDYLVAQEAPEHGWLGFSFDCCILMGLWTAAASVYVGASSVPDIRSLCVALSAVYVLFLVYLFLVGERVKHRALVVIVEVFGLLWFTIGAVWMNTAFAATGLLLSGILLGWAANKALHQTVV